jgi:diguanylate cyclase (GGDEF)-like protein
MCSLASICWRIIYSALSSNPVPMPSRQLSVPIRIIDDHLHILANFLGLTANSETESLLVDNHKLGIEVEQPMMLNDQQLHISVSIGIATAPHDDISSVYLIRDADAAMYEATRQGRATYRFFSGELTSRATKAL